jgi:hypothetical protein
MWPPRCLPIRFGSRQGWRPLDEKAKCRDLLTFHHGAIINRLRGAGIISIQF